ncbi:MAG: ATP-dependent helicase [Treponema sp.]|jgi:DNA helicase-2/ATP-dependent DNA helicase PcrA|nr:ATP-dependent helicase [Treponema sp.]
MTASPALDQHLSLLNPEQLEAVQHNSSPLLILAGAGSGKTRVITTKIAWLIGAQGADPRSILAVTFTKKAANEMAGRARQMESRAEQCRIQTFHSFGARLLRFYPEDAGLSANFTVYDDDDTVTLVSKAVPKLNRQQAARFAHKISLAKDYCLDPDSPELAEIDSTLDFPAVYRAYQNRLRGTGNADFGDLIMLPVKLLEENDRVRTAMQRRYETILVDEYQDSNAAQFRLLKALAGPGAYICVVGDDDQSIYHFRGAEIQNMLSFEDAFPGALVIRLERNYRSVSPVLSLADAVVRRNQGRLGKTLRAERGKGKKPVLAFLPDQDEETAFCAEMIEQSHNKGVLYGDWAILYRTNAQSPGFETEFLRRKIPYRVVGSLKFYEREEIKDALSWLAFMANRRDEVAFRRIINKPARGIGEVTVEKIIHTAYSSSLSFIDACREFTGGSKKAAGGIGKFIGIFDTLAALLPPAKPPEDNGTPAVMEDGMRLSAFAERLVTESGLDEYHSARDEIAGTQRLANLQELANAATLYPLSTEGLLDFLDHIELDRGMELDTSENADTVTLITLHNTKGLEFPKVIITGLESGIFPRDGKSTEELEEERRLFYVGITRAKDELYLTACARRRIYGRTEFCDPSPFLYEIDRDLVSIIGNPPPDFAGSRGGTAPPDPEQQALLNQWPKGARLFHDDYGYGTVVSRSVNNGEVVIKVVFENGGEKHFMPKYQEAALLRIGDE